MNNSLVVPLPTARAIAALGVKCECFFFRHPVLGICSEADIWDRGETHIGAWDNVDRMYTLGELPAVLEAIGKAKGWTLEFEIRIEKYHKLPFPSDQLIESAYDSREIVSSWTYYFLEICRLYSESPEKGWSYLDNLLK